jgi:GNAT superfamily N-acetyltransferase
VSAICRLATPGDVEPLLSLIHAHADYERSSATISAVQLARLLAMEDAPVSIIVAQIDNRIVGFAALTLDYSLWRARHWGHLDCLFIEDGCRGSSIGQQLLAAVAALARQRGADQLEWQTPEWNVGAVKFYRRHHATDAPKIRFCLPLARSDVGRKTPNPNKS